MIKSIGSLFAALLLLCASAAHAIPITFEFSGSAVGAGGSFNPALVVPAPFDDTYFASGAPVSGTFTIETDTPGHAGYVQHNGVWIPAATAYTNSVRQLELNVRDQQFSFAGTQPPGTTRVRESSVSVLDLPSPATEPLWNRDGADLSINLGSGLFSGPYSHLAATLTLSRTERDLSVITASDILSALAPSANWNMFFTLYDPALTQSYYQMHIPITSLVQVTSVPEPGTAALLGLGLVLTIVAAGGRNRSARMI